MLLAVFRVPRAKIEQLGKPYIPIHPRGYDPMRTRIGGQRVDNAGCERAVLNTRAPLPARAEVRAKVASPPIEGLRFPAVVPDQAQRCAARPLTDLSPAFACPRARFPAILHPTAPTLWPTPQQKTVLGHQPRSCVRCDRRSAAMARGCANAISEVTRAAPAPSVLGGSPHRCGPLNHRP